MKTLYLGEGSKRRETARASGFASPLACLPRVHFSRYPPNEELARGLFFIFLLHHIFSLYTAAVSLDATEVLIGSLSDLVWSKFY